MEHPIHSIRKIARVLRLSSAVTEQALGISSAQLYVLRSLRDRTDGSSINELATRTLTDRSSVSTIVRNLVERKLVTRELQTDRRTASVLLTPIGEAVLAIVGKTAQERLIAALDALPAAESRALARTLEKVLEKSGLIETQ